MAAINAGNIESFNDSNLYTDYINGERICLDCTEGKTKLDMNKNEITSNSLVRDFYAGKNVFVTGATGFLGKILVEKLLRCCPGVENLYLLVRPKRGKDIYTRIDELFDDPVFDRLKDEVPKFRHKIVPIPGDCNANNLGMSISDRQDIIEKINIIFHSAATVKFDEHLRTAIVTNVKAPLYLLRMAREIKNLNVLMHVSTAYSNCHLPLIEEKFYSCNVNCEDVSEQIDKLTDSQIDEVLPSILGPWPNTYTFTKALAEKELRENCQNVPLGVFRPAIVTSTAKEPIPSWIDNMYGPTGVAVGGATGVLRTLLCDESIVADIVPVDYVVNCLISVARHVHVTYQQRQQTEDPPIFNFVSSVENKITWGEFMAKNMARINDYPLNSAVWYISLTLQNSALMNNIYIFLLHLIPGALLDGLAMCVGQKPRMLKVYRKIHKFSSVISYFSTREFNFCNRKTRELWDSTSAGDRELFPFSMKQLDWDDYFSHYLSGIRKYIFKEPDNTLEQAKIKWRRLYYLHQVVRAVFTIFGLYLIYTIFTSVL